MPADFAGGLAVVIDILRASTTIVTALANGARCVIPCGGIAAAREAANHFVRGDVLLGGERGGVRIDGFDLDNSPARYSAEAVRGKSIVFTTTNGTAALLHSRCAERIFVGALVNVSVIVQVLTLDPRPIHLVCAGTDGHVTAEDVLCAGALVKGLEDRAGPFLFANDQTLIARELWSARSGSPDSLTEIFRASRGGRNLVELGYEADIREAMRIDRYSLVPEYFAKTNRIEAVR